MTTSTELDQFTQITGYSDKLAMLRSLLTYPMINWVSQFFSRTRSGDAELYFVDYCRGVILQNMDKISGDEFLKYDRVLIYYELSAYDRLNLWHDYIRLYEDTLSKGIHSLDALKPRYEIICRKQKRADEEKTVEHLRRHQQKALTEDELNTRYAELGRLFEYIKRNAG